MKMMMSPHIEHLVFVAEYQLNNVTLPSWPDFYKRPINSFMLQVSISNIRMKYFSDLLGSDTCPNQVQMTPNYENDPLLGI